MNRHKVYNSTLYHSMADGYRQLILEVGNRKFGENEALDEIGIFVLERGRRCSRMNKSKLATEINQWVIWLRNRYSK